MYLHWSGRSVDYTGEDLLAVVEAMVSDPQTQGVYQKEFERVFSEYHGRPSFAVSSGAAALELASMVVEKGEVIIPAHTYCATAIPFARRGFDIKWADIDPDYRTVTAKTIEPLITKRTRVIVVVHLYGMSAPMDDIMELAEAHSLTVVEDCAQSLGAEYKGKKSGTHGYISCYSFHGQKNISTLGEGGMISTDEDYGLRGLRHNGHRGYPNSKEVDFDIEGVYPYNFSIGEAQCAVGISQMKRLDEMNARRRKNARFIIDNLADIEELEFQKIPEGSTHTYHLLCARYPDRDRLIKRMAEQGVECQIQYMPLYRQPLFRDFVEHDCPNSDDFYDHAISFPLYEWYSEEQLNYLLDSIRKGITL